MGQLDMKTQYFYKKKGMDFTFYLSMGPSKN